MKKENLWTKICANCPFCKYTRIHKKKLFKIIEFFCPICRLASSSKQEGKHFKGKTKLKEFEERYSIEPIQKEDKKIEEDLAKRIKTVLETLHKRPYRASTMAYYQEILSSSVRIDELKKTKEKGMKIIGTFCNFVPKELIYACDSIPIRLCAGAYETIFPAEEILPRDICPLIKSSLGYKILGLGYFQLCDLVIIPSSCDGKKKLGEILNNFLPVWILEVPQRKNHRQAKDFWFNQIKLLKMKLEKFTGVKITQRRLKQAIELLHKSQAIFRQLLELRKHNPPLINGRDFLLVIQASFYDDIDRWIDKTQQLYKELINQHSVNGNQRRGNKKLRILLTGAPIIWPNYKLVNIIEDMGAEVVADDLCSGTQALYDPVEVDEWTQEAMLKAVAYRYLLPTTCPCFIESNDRIDKILNLINEFKIDGVIYHNLRLCQLYDIELYKVKQVLKSRKIPILNIYTDYSPEDQEQIKTRIEAFLEMVKTR